MKPKSHRRFAYYWDHWDCWYSFFFLFLPCPALSCPFPATRLLITYLIQETDCTHSRLIELIRISIVRLQLRPKHILFFHFPSLPFPFKVHHARHLNPLFPHLHLPPISHLPSLPITFSLRYQNQSIVFHKRIPSINSADSKRGDWNSRLVHPFLSALVVFLLIESSDNNGIPSIPTIR